MSVFLLWCFMITCGILWIGCAALAGYRFAHKHYVWAVVLFLCSILNGWVHLDALHKLGGG